MIHDELEEAGNQAGSVCGTVPACYANPLSIDKNEVHQLLVREQPGLIEHDGVCRQFRVQIETGEVVAIMPEGSQVASGKRVLALAETEFDRLRESGDLSSAKWTGTHQFVSPDTVRRSLGGGFRFKVDDPANGISGLRSPQLGAVHSVLGYWTTNEDDPATVVMPTGTGKTDTMIALFCAAPIERLLIVVPSDALRTQIARKFESLGILQSFEIVPRSCPRPVVGQIKHGFKTTENARQFANLCNVVVATPSALSASPPEIRSALFDRCSHLFVDEAHHVTAPTWRAIRDEFGKKRVVQFTATPYREDGRHLGGRFIYTFPLREAQLQGYFAEIEYISVLDFGDHDRAIAQRAIATLREDLAAGRDHLILARVNRIGRATDILSLYEKLAPNLGPVILHSGFEAKYRQEALNAIVERRSRIVICVNMLGEGFDLPALKIAAIHDTHKSLAVTLQFVGRFARTSGSVLGSATVVVGRPDGNFDPRLRRLYSEDADWNFIINDLSDGAITQEEGVSEFEAGFSALPDEVSIRSLLPKMSTVVYRVDPDRWDPHRVKDLYGDDHLLTDVIAINERDGVAWFVRENRTTVSWGELRTVEEISHDLFVLYLDRDRGLLYINSSDNESVHEHLAKAVCGDAVAIIKGENVYRVMAQVKRLVPTNVGLLDVRNRSRRFSMHVGADVVEGFPVAEAQTKTKTNIFAYGFDHGSRVSIGAALKGRIEALG